NFLVFGNPLAADDATRVQGKNRYSDVKDGMSNTVFFGEIYASCGMWGSPDFAAASLWADSTLPWRPIMCHNGLFKDTAYGYAPCNKFQVQPQMFANCDPSRGQSAHTGGTQVGMGDTSVRWVNQTVSDATWAAACDPRDGNPLGSDW